MKTLTVLIILIIFNLINLTNLKAQVTQEWVQRYDGQAEEDYANSIAVDGSGNVYVTGTSGNGKGADYVTIKYNSSGVQQWIQKYDGPGNQHDGATALAVDSSGNVYVTGTSEGSGTGGNYATIKYNSAGVQQWVQRYDGGGFFDRANSIAIDGSANVYVTGYSIGSGTGFDYATIKYNSAGIQQWVQRYDGPGNDYDIANSIAVDGSGNVYVTGSSDGGGPGFDFATIKYNSSGVQQWVQRYNGSATSIAVDGSGNVYVTGLSSGSEPHMDYATIKYNSIGEQQWIQRYDGPGSSVDYANSIAVDGSANVYVTGLSSGIGTFGDYATIKYNSIGVQQWIQRYNGPGNGSDEAESLVVDDSGNVYVTGGGRPIGFSRGDGGGTNKDYATIKYNSSGVQQWIQRYNGPGDSVDYATSIAVDGSGNVFVSGGSIGNGTNYDYATIKYSQPVGIPPIPNEIPNEYMLSQNYPNPFNPTTNINYELTITNYVSLKVFDMLGNQVASLVNEKQNPGSYSVEFDGSNFPSGVYFYRLVVSQSNPIKAEGFLQTKRMMLIK